MGVNPLMLFNDDSPIAINHVGFSSDAALTNDEWTVPDEFISGPGECSEVHSWSHHSGWQLVTWRADKRVKLRVIFVKAYHCVWHSLHS